MDAVSCNGDKIAIVGRIRLPSMHINMIKIPVQVSFWVMTQPVDGVIIANKWLTSPLRAALAWCEQLQSQVLYFKIPTTPLLAGGKTVKKADTKHSGPQENDPPKEGHKDKKLYFCYYLLTSRALPLNWLVATRYLFKMEISFLPLFKLCTIRIF